MMRGYTPVQSSPALIKISQRPPAKPSATPGFSQACRSLLQDDRLAIPQQGGDLNNFNRLHLKLPDPAHPVLLDPLDQRIQNHNSMDIYEEKLRKILLHSCITAVIGVVLSQVRLWIFRDLRELFL